MRHPNSLLNAFLHTGYGYNLTSTWSIRHIESRQCQFKFDLDIHVICQNCFLFTAYRFWRMAFPYGKNDWLINGDNFCDCMYTVWNFRWGNKFLLNSFYYQLSSFGLKSRSRAPYTNNVNNKSTVVHLSMISLELICFKIQILNEHAMCMSGLLRVNNY